MSTTTAASGPATDSLKPVYVYEAPVRIWHWTHAISIIVLSITGYLIANPLPAIHGEASDHFLMGYMRMIHFIAGYVFAIGFAVRIYWAFVGNRFSRELFIPPVWSREWRGHLMHKIKFNLFLTRKMEKTVAHNPLAQVAMWFFNVIVGLFMVVSGFALYGEGLGVGSWADRWFGWLIPMMGSSMEVKMWHTLGMWLIIVFAIIHIYMAVRSDIMGRESCVSTIIGGWRFWKDDRP